MSRSVSAVSMARSEYCSCPPRVPTPTASQVAIASGANHTVISPRWTSARSYAGQFPTWYFVLYFGCTLDFMSRSCTCCRHDGQEGDRGSPTARDPCTNATIQGRQQYLWRAVDEDGDVLDILVQSHRNRRAAVRFFRKLLKTHGRTPRRLITEQLRSYAAACRTVMPSVVHVTDQYANNRAEVSHQPTRQRERQMRRFKSAAHVQRFASVHGVVQNLFRVGRHLLRSRHHRVLRKWAFVEWDAATCAC